MARYSANFTRKLTILFPAKNHATSHFHAYVIQVISLVKLSNYKLETYIFRLL